jgi:ABC-2 type transport system ATP-binding protein
MNDIQISNISYTVKGKEILKNLTFSVEQGEVFALIGKNGSGKSSLIDVMLHDLKPDRGEVLLFGNKKYNNRKLGVLYDHLPLISLLRVEEMIQYYCTVYRLRYKDVAAEFFHDFDIEGIRRSYIRTLSLGERKRVSLLLAVMHNPDLLVLDEPFANVDPTICDRIWKVLIRPGRTIFFTTHNWIDAEKRADRVAFMAGGVLMGPPLSPEKAMAGLPSQQKMVLAHNSQLETVLQKEAYYLHEGNMVCFIEANSPLLGIVAQHTTNFSIQDVDLTDVYLYHLKAGTHA